MLAPSDAANDSKEVREQVGWQLADGAPQQTQVELGVGAAAKVDSGEGEGFVEGHVGRTGAHDAGLVAERLAEGLPEREGGVLDGVVGIDVEVARWP